jgi:phospholipid/cholesterol/gamma-HCH transport system substrate-binding protein
MPRTRLLAWTELKLGIVAVLAIALSTVLILAVGGQGGFFWQRYPLRVRFDDVQGLKPGAIVRLNGMEVGKVTEVQFADAQVEVVLEVSKSVRSMITDQSEAAMGTLSLLGEPIIVIRASQEGAPLADDGYLKVGVGTGVADLAVTAQRSAKEAAHLLADVRAGRGSVGQLFTDEALYAELEALTSSAARVAERLNDGQGTLGALATDPAAYVAMRGALENLESFTSQLRQGRGALGRLAGDEALGRSLSATTGNLVRITERLSSGEGTAGKLLATDELYQRTAVLMDRMDRLVGALETGRGTAGQMLNDPRLYENVNLAADELRGLIADIKRDPKRYLSVSFSVF